MPGQIIRSVSNGIKPVMKALYTVFSIFKKLQFIALTGYATVLSLIPDPGDDFNSIWDKYLHLACWMVLGLSLWLALPAGKRIFAPAAWLLAYSVLIEILQHILPERQFSLLDIVANALGIGCAIAAVTVYEQWLLPMLWPKKS